MPTYKLLLTPHNHYITHTLHHLLSSIGKRVTVVNDLQPTDSDDPTILYIITFCQHVDPMPKYYIVYQLEQMHYDKYKNNASYKNKLLNALQCWEYNAHNTSFYANASSLLWFPVPIANIPTVFTSDPVDQPQPIDVLFYGAVNDRRYRILKRLHSILHPRRITVKLIRGFYGESLYPFIRRSRVVLNLGFREDTLLATYRINEVLVHNRVVVSEATTHQADKSTIDEYAQNAGVVFIPPISANLSNLYPALVQPILHLLNNNKRYMQHKKRGEWFVRDKERFFQQLLRHILK